MLVPLWTDILIFLLVGAVAAFAFHARRREHLRAPWRRVGSSAVAMVSLVVLGIYVLVGLLDSVHYRPSLPPASEGAPTEYSTEVLSVFDAMVAHLRHMEEKTYSAPFATHLFVKETVELPDGGTERAYPRLVHGGSHLQDPERDRIPDIAATAVGAVIVALVAWCAVCAAFIALWARRNRRPFGAPTHMTRRPNTLMGAVWVFREAFFRAKHAGQDATPDDPNSDFRIYLDQSMSAILAAGFDATNDLGQIDVYSEDLSLLIFADGFEWGDTSEWSSAVPSKASSRRTLRSAAGMR